MERILEEIYNERAEEIDSDIWEAVTNVFNKATEEGFGEPLQADRFFYEALKYNNAVYSAFRCHAMQEAFAGQLVAEDGKLKSFSDFRRDVRQHVEPRWLDDWLKTEYNTAVGRAHTAAVFRRAERDRDVLPNLRWVRSTSVHPGADHTVFWGTVQPIDSPFWNKHRPGDRWNCKCDLEPTDDPPTDVPEGTEGDKPAPGLENNPGKDAKIFSDNHPFIKGASRKRRRAVAERVEGKPEDFKFTRKTFKSGGVIETEGKQYKHEAKKNLKAYTFLAKTYGEKYRLLGVDKTMGVKNPDALNLTTRMLSDVKVQEGGNIKNTIQNAAKRASAQQSPELYIFLTSECSMMELRIALKTAFQKGRNSKVKKVIIRLADGEVKRFDADMLHRAFK